MERRDLLAAIGTTGIGLAGCTTLKSVAGLSSSKTIGETATYEGVEFTPTKYLVTNSLKQHFTNHTRKATAPDGAAFVLTQLHVVHNGDSAVEFPGNGMGEDAIHLHYSGERLSAAGIGMTAQRMTVSGKTLPTYSAVLNEKASGEVYPGTEARGWIANEVAANYSPPDLELRVIWNNHPFGADGEVTQTWTYTVDARTSIDEIKGSSSTISI